MTDQITIRGARLHNLKNVTLAIPKNKLVVLTGLSGSGKSTLAFDILHKEGQRQYMESLGMISWGLSRPPVDSISGCPHPSASTSISPITARAPRRAPSRMCSPTCGFYSVDWVTDPARIAAGMCRRRPLNSLKSLWRKSPMRARTKCLVARIADRLCRKWAWPISRSTSRPAPAPPVPGWAVAALYLFLALGFGWFWLKPLKP